MQQARGNILFRLLVAGCFILLGLTASAVGQVRKRLILKDGSWQEITKYEVVGERARYFSSQRGEWEDVPRELVDWKATEEWNARPLQIPPDEEERSGSEVDPLDALTVAPGLRLPSEGGVFVFDTFSGRPSLLELTQQPGVRKSYGTKGIFHSAIKSNGSATQSFELKGLHARSQAHVALPRIFVKIAASDQANPIAPADRFRIVRLHSTIDSRVLASVDVTVTGKQSQTQQFVPARVESFSDGWSEITPLQDLEPGEYAVVEMLRASEFNSYAWDFGVDPHAPGNLNSRTASAAGDETNTVSPQLEPRVK